jgi:NTP pyrophosphatase (non-canonical NTP hydrolase)
MIGDKMQRPQITDKEVENAVRIFRNKLEKARLEKGNDSWASTHEIFGLLTEEVREVEDEVRTGNKVAMVDELLDVAVIAVFGVACLTSKEGVS